ncbi:MAG: acyl-CoA synthetase (AMP-forming)/AMP-acid ligase II [Limisphaerales bacterium]|jgi:acyl-CoA synthetase (AMP-forming)/AMP-acid ligase II
MLVEDDTIGGAFDRVAGTFANHDFMVVPKDVGRRYYSGGFTHTFYSASSVVDDLTVALRGKGYGHGHRIAVLLENRPEMLLLKLACNKLGVSWVPLNPDYRTAEMAYVLRDSDAVLVVTVASHEDTVRAAVDEAGIAAQMALWGDDAGLTDLPMAVALAPIGGAVDAQSEASLLYTSGTTGQPKGCIMSHEYELMMGAWYASRGGLFTLQTGAERVYNPLPLFHVNAGIVQFYGLMLSGNCMVIPERFSRTRWWSEIRETGSTGCHYLGVVIPVLMNELVSDADRDHPLRWGFGAGVEPTLHRSFEERFGFPLIEVWGMTEMCRVLVACEEPRHIGSRAMGRPQVGLDVRVVDEADQDVDVGEPGEMVVRHSAEAPRKGAFSGYLNQEKATEEGWRGGWWHTGDTVRQDASGMLYFVDRKKNIIRRSGENIAAAEVEAVLQAHEAVAQVAVMAVEDEMRDEEVLACVVSSSGANDAELALTLFEECYAQLTYYKAPGWIVFIEKLPVTGTQKVLKHKIFGEDVDPRQLPQAHDFRDRKKR